MTESKVKQTLETIGAIVPANLYQLAPRTRDREVPVFKDSQTGVIFIDDYYAGTDDYTTGEYPDHPTPNLEDLLDTERRVSSFRPFYFGRSILDYGCGTGNFLRAVHSSTSSAFGVELQSSLSEALNEDGIPCYPDISQIPPVDTAFMFHVLEHLPDPLAVLSQLHDTLDPRDGNLVVEVPHANDFLLSQLNCKEFTEFTLWSQHLVLHTRDSLRKLLMAAGFLDIRITGVQRYGLANHLTWLSEGKPGGHKGPISLLETTDLSRAYQSALAAMDCTDTIVAIARVSSNR